MTTKLIFVFLGSGLGGACRWLISNWMNGSYPVGTLCVNVVGCFLLGLLTKAAPGNEHLRLLLMAGFCGGFTTYSTFINENLGMMRSHELLLSLGYTVASLTLGLLAAWTGYTVYKM